MERRAAFIANKYYTDAGMEYVFARLCEEFSARGVTLEKTNAYASFPFPPPACDFAVFWDKDVALARRWEKAGVRLFNSSAAIETCDDKEKTFSALDGCLDLPATVVAPLVYDISDGTDERFLQHVVSLLGFPVVVKACVGSQGRQVFLAQDEAQLRALRKSLMHTPHLYQRFVRGAEAGADTRVYVIGGKAIGAAERHNTTDFRSSVALGGTMQRVALPESLREQAEKAAAALRLDYGSVDFICEDGNFVFIEANSAAYMQNAEKLGIALAAKFAAFVTETVYGTNG